MKCIPRPFFADIHNNKIDANERNILFFIAAQGEGLLSGSSVYRNSLMMFGKEQLNCYYNGS